MKSTKEIFLKLLLLFGSIVFSLVLCEVGLRLISPGYSPMSLDIYRLDGQGVLGMRPNLTRRHLTAEWDVAVTLNADGLRDRDQPLNGNGGTILAVGDSYAFGWGVELADTFLYRVEEALRPEAVRVVKAGIPGTGTSDQLLWLQHYGPRFQPGLIIVCFCVGNDFVDVQKGGVPGQFIVKDGLMEKKAMDGKPPSWWKTVINKVKRSSLLGQRVAELVWTYERRIAAQQRQHAGLRARDPWLWEFYKVHLRPAPPETRQAFELTLQALDDIHQWCEQRQVPMLLLAIPRSIQIYDWELERWKQSFKVQTEELDIDQPQRVLAEWATNEHVLLCDLLPAFRLYAKEHPKERLFFYPDSHMNANGHRLTASLLADSLKRNKIRPRLQDASKAN